jgi:outer membrane protein insertion porin family
MILGNLELRIPLFWLFYGEIFTDGGNVWTDFNRIKILSPKMSSGSGIAIMTPLGAIRFDYGLKWFPQRNESKGEFHIGISFAF